MNRKWKWCSIRNVFSLKIANPTNMVKWLLKYTVGFSIIWEFFEEVFKDDANIKRKILFQIGILDPNRINALHFFVFLT